MLSKIIRLLIVVGTLSSCKFPTQEKRSIDDATTSYKLQLQPKTGSVYHYDIINSSAIELTANDQETQTVTKTSAGINYIVGKDSAGNLVMDLKYTDLKLYTKNGDREQELEATHSKVLVDPAEQMLTALQDAQLQAIVSPTGEVIRLNGYNELSESLMANLSSDNPQATEIAQQKIDQMIGDNLIKKNFSQLFRIFPDSIVRLGEKWKIDSRASTDFLLNSVTYYELEDINDGMATIRFTSEISSDKSILMTFMGYTATSELKGGQTGEYKIDITTGMLVVGETNGNLSGNLQIAGRTIPVTIKVTSDIKGEQKK